MLRSELEVARLDAFRRGLDARLDERIIASDLVLLTATYVEEDEPRFATSGQ